MKDYCIKMKIGCLIAVIFLGIVGGWIFQKERTIKVIGESKWAFDIVFRNWNEDSEIKRFHRTIQLMKDQYILVESGATNGTMLQYYLVNLDKKQIQANFFGIKGTFPIGSGTVETIKYFMKPIKEENQIYDGTSKMSDGDVYFLTVYNKKQTLKYGFYSLSGYFGRYGNKGNERIALINRIIFENLLKEIEGEIYCRKHQLFKERPFFNCEVG